MKVNGQQLSFSFELLKYIVFIVLKNLVRSFFKPGFSSTPVSNTDFLVGGEEIKFGVYVKYSLHLDLQT